MSICFVPPIADKCLPAMPAMTRTWTIPAMVESPEISLQIHEPSLTGDSLGLKTWGSSYLLAKRLEDINLQYLGDIRGKQQRILELGSGTGLVGLAAAAIWQSPIWLTDLPEIVPNLKKNAELNEQTILSSGGRVAVEELDWDDPHPSLEGEEFQVRRLSQHLK